MAVPTPKPTFQIANFCISQAAWFAVVLGAAHGLPQWGTACALAAIGWHLSLAARPAREACLVGLAMAIGLVIESAQVASGHVAYASGQLDPRLAPWWIVALWGLFAIQLNVTLRWLRDRPWLAALLGATAGPLAFASGVRLGAAHFVEPRAALASAALAWAVALPLLLRLSVRFDGVAAPEPVHA